MESKYGISLTIFMNYFFAFEEAYFKIFVNILKYYVNNLKIIYKNRECKYNMSIKKRTKIEQDVQSDR